MPESTEEKSCRECSAPLAGLYQWPERPEGFFLVLETVGGRRHIFSVNGCVMYGWQWGCDVGYLRESQVGQMASNLRLQGYTWERGYTSCTNLYGGTTTTTIHFGRVQESIDDSNILI